MTAPVLTSSGAVFMKAGKNVSTDLISGTITGGTTSGVAVDEIINQAEHTVSAESRVDWVAQYAGLSANTKKILDRVASSLAAIDFIAYDPGEYTNLGEAQTKMNVLDNESKQGLEQLKSSNVAKEFLGGTQ